MTDHVTTTDIADLMRRLRHLHEQRPADPANRPRYWPARPNCSPASPTTTPNNRAPATAPPKPHEIAIEAQAIAQNAHRLARTGGAKSEEHPPPF